MEQTFWKPDADWIARSRVRRFLDHLGLADYHELLARSAADPAWFWAAFLDFAGVAWFAPWQQVVDVSAGAPWARWFTGGRLNVAYNVLDRHAGGPLAGQDALVWEGEDGAVRRFTYAGLLVQVNRAANALRRLGVGRGDRVALYLPMLPEAVVAQLACLRIGAVYMPVFSGFAGDALTDRLADAGAKVVVTADGFYRGGKVVPLKAQADPSVARVAGVQHVLVVRRLGLAVPWQAGRDLWWDDALAGMPEVCAPEWLESNEPALLIHTSGTSGRPKGVVRSQVGLLANIVEGLSLHFDLRAGETLFWVTDWGWVTGPSMYGVGAPFMGATGLMYEGSPAYPDPGRLWRLISTHRVNLFGLAPTAVRSLMAAGDRWLAGHDLGTLRVLGSTGEAMDPESWQWLFRQVGGGRCPIINGSGGTEVGFFLICCPAEPIKPVTVGHPCPGMAVDLFDDDGRPVAGAGVPGYLVCRKPWPGMTQGLWQDPERYLEAYWSRWPDVWDHGDWAVRDDDGYWYLLGRADDTIKVAGRRTGPAEIESALMGHPAVAAAAAVGVPDPVKGSRLVCLVVLHSGWTPADDLRAALQDQVARSLGRALRPDLVRFVRDLPRNRSGKVVRRAVREAFLGQAPGAAAADLENPEALAEVARSV